MMVKLSMLWKLNPNPNSKPNLHNTHDTFDTHNWKDILNMTEESLPTNNVNYNSTGFHSPLKKDTIVVPIDLGQGYVVYIVGLPGCPSQAACDRISNVIQSFATKPHKSVEAELNPLRHGVKHNPETDDTGIIAADNKLRS